MTAGHDEAARTEYRGRSEDRADVMWVCHLVEHDQRTPIRSFGEVAPIGLGEGLGFQRRSLMDCIGPKQPIKVAWGDMFDRRGDLADGLAQAPFRVLGQQKTKDAASRVPQGGFDGVETEKPDRPFVLVCIGAGFGPLRPAAKGRVSVTGWKRPRALLVAPRLIGRRFLQGSASKARAVFRPVKLRSLPRPAGGRKGASALFRLT